MIGAAMALRYSLYFFRKRGDVNWAVVASISTRKWEVEDSKEIWEFEEKSLQL
jgi:hypothetical protein